MGFLDKAKALGSKTVEEGKKYAEITKLNMEISTIQEQIKENKIAIGDAFVNLNANSGLEGIVLPEPVLSQIREFNDKIIQFTQNIQNLQNKIDELKNVGKCLECGADIAGNEKFCSKCGTIIPEAVQ